MSEYESIHGTRVKYLTSDPTLDSSTEGQVWYNSNSGTNKALVQIKAWAATGNVNTKRISAGGSGTTTAGITAGGRNGDASPQGDHQTEEYTGYLWNNGADMSNDRFETEMAGPMSAAVIVGGYDIALSPEKIANVEEYNGTSWTNGTAYPSAVFAGGAAGTQTAAVYFGGYFPPPTNLQASTKEYDGSSWTASGNMVEGRGYMASCGSQTSALAVCGKVSPSVDVEEYDGSSWTTGGNYPTSNVNAAASGLSTAAIVFSGATAPGGTAMSLSAAYDGSAFTTDASLATAREQASGSSQGTSKSAWCCLGNPTSPGLATEEYDSNINAFTSAAFASGGALSTSRAQFGSAKHGTQNAGLAFGGFNWPNTNRSETEEYGGSSWTSGGALPGGQRQMGGTGTQTAGLGYGGLPGIPNTTTLEYDGSSWTSGGAIPGGVTYAVNSAAGTQTAALRAGSSSPSAASTTTLEYDGSSWTSANSMSVARTSATFDGAQTAAIITTGEAPAAPDATGSVTRLTEEYDGTNWSSGTSSLFFLSAQGVSGGSAAQTALMTTGGDGPEVTNNTGATQEYDGTAFMTTANLGTPRRQLNGGGTQAAGLVFGGTEASTTALTATEEYTGTTSTVTASTLTTS